MLQGLVELLEEIQSWPLAQRLAFGILNEDGRDVVLFFQLDPVFLRMRGSIPEHFGDIAKESAILVGLLILGVMHEIEAVGTVLVDDFQFQATQRLVDFGPGNVEGRLHLDQRHILMALRQYRRGMALARAHGPGGIRRHLGARRRRGFAIGCRRGHVFRGSRRFPSRAAATAGAIDGAGGEIRGYLQRGDFRAVLILLLLVRKPAGDGAASPQHGRRADQRQGASSDEFTHDGTPESRRPDAWRHGQRRDTPLTAR